MSGKSSEYDNDFLNQLIGDLLDLFFKMLFGDAEEQEVVDKMGLSDDAVKMLGAYKFKVRETLAKEYDTRAGLTGVEKTELQQERQIKYINERIQQLKEFGLTPKEIYEFNPTNDRKDLFDVTFVEDEYIQSLNEYMNAVRGKISDSILLDEKFENPPSVSATSGYVDDTKMLLDGKFQSIKEQYYAHFDLKISEPNPAVDALIKETFGKLAELKKYNKLYSLLGLL